MAVDENKAVARRYVEEGFNAGSMEALDELFAPDFVNHDPGVPMVRDLEGLKENMRLMRQAFPDIQTSIDALLNEGDYVTKRFTVRGTHQGEFNGIPPTGKQIECQGIDILRISEGKIQEIWMSFDYLGVLQQLGVLPSLSKSEHRHPLFPAPECGEGRQDWQKCGVAGTGRCLRLLVLSIRRLSARLRSAADRHFPARQ